MANVPYKYRNLPASIQTDDKLWCVVGRFVSERGDGGGVLEWCYDEQDASAVLDQMTQDGQFRNLQATTYKQFCG